MKRAALAMLVVLLPACVAHGDHPARPGDAGVGDGSAGDGGLLEGRVCVVTDLRKLTTCSTTGAKGLLVSLGSAPSFSIDSDDGHFTFAASSSTDLVWHVSSATADRIVASAMRYGTDHTIPVISTQTYTDLRALYGAGNPVDQQASVVVRAMRGIPPVPVADVGATTTLTQNNPIFYDGDPARKDDWGTARTGVAGVVWFPGVSLAPSTGMVTLTPQGSSTSVQVPVTVQDSTITFVTKDLP
ncbi:MAG TPA: hypothetical protein VF469_04540 [Kofleriaceae bacterium]